MAKSIRVIISGKEYLLRGDDEKLVQQVAREVNQQLSELEKSHRDESATTLSVLTALNIAEKHLIAERQNENNKKYVIDELDKISDYLEKINNLQDTN
jgi:cell division protein ZapA (FtsZ GTPase activity inhibitor)